jgi:Zn-dependent protease with chaperone function
MADLMLYASLVLPLLAVVLVGRYFERGLVDAAPEEQARRRYRLSWVVTPVILVQAGLLWSILSNWGEQMATPAWLFAQMDAFASLLMGVIGRPATAAVLSVFGMVVIVLYYSLYSLPWLRLDRIAKRAQGSSMRNAQLKLTLRGTLAGFLPLMLWIGVLLPFLSQFFARGDVATFALILASFLLLVHSLSPWQIQLANPTAPLPAEHPVAAMARELCAQAGVGIDQVRVLKLGETRVANALVAGLWPKLRRIYLTDHMLESFSVAEIRAILAHEVGHIRHRHLWWYLGFALGGVFVIPRLVDALAQFDLLGDSLWSVLIALGLYWGVMFKFLSRRFERQADRFAVAATGDVATFQFALEKLAEVNGMVKRYSKWDIFQTHPPIAERVKAVA